MNMATEFGKKIQARLLKLPNNPGIYLFYNSKKDLVYVGKATSLRSRVRSYFRGNEPTRLVEAMIHEVADIDYKETDSALEAIILESIYIKKYLPRYNILGKDSKSWNYIVITADQFPKVATVRQHELATLKQQDENILKQYKYIFGPYPGLNSRAAMKLLRRIFNFTNCDPGTRPCLYHQMGQCPGVCAGIISQREYKQKIIRPLATFLQGKKKQVIKMFEGDMKRAAEEERFEEAGRLRNQLDALYRIQDIALLNKSFVRDAEMLPPAHIAEVPPHEKTDRELFGRRLKGAPVPHRWGAGEAVSIRVEGYDISNLGAAEKVGSMVVFNEYEPVKSEYRKFVIKGVSGQSDVDSLAEMLERRLNHLEWPLPTVMLIDGGRPQVNKAAAVLAKRRVRVPVVGIAKGPERKRNDFILGNKDPEFIAWVAQHQQLLIQVRDEAHRFAITFHRKRRSQKFLMV